MNIHCHALTDAVFSSRRAGQVGAAVLLALSLLMAQGCASQATFDSADQAVDALVAAARTQDAGQLAKVLSMAVMGD